MLSVLRYLLLIGIQIRSGRGMKFPTICFVIALCAFSATPCQSQNTGRIECPRNDGYVYLYSSVTTLEVRSTLQCGEIVQITGRFDDYLGIRNSKGETGFVPLSSIVLLKDQQGTGLPPTLGAPARERIHYDNGPDAVAAAPHNNGLTFTLLQDTVVHVKLLKTLSSGSSHVGDPVEFEILDDVSVENVVVLRKGTKVSGVVAESDPKKRFGHNGKLAVTIKAMPLVNGKTVAVRCYQSVSAVSATSSADGAIAISSGKDAVLLQNTELTALIDTNTPLKREEFANPSHPAISPTPTAQPR